MSFQGNSKRNTVKYLSKPNEKQNQNTNWEVTVFKYRHGGEEEEKKRAGKTYNPPQLQKSPFSLLTSIISFTNSMRATSRNPRPLEQTKQKAAWGEVRAQVLKILFNSILPVFF